MLEFGPIFFVAVLAIFIYVMVSSRKSKFEDINEGFRSTGDIIVYVVLGIVGLLLLIWLISTGLGHK